MGKVRLIRVFKEVDQFDDENDSVIKCYTFYTNSRYENYLLHRLLYETFGNIFYKLKNSYFGVNKSWNDRKRRRVWFDDSRNLEEQVNSYYYDNSTRIILHHYLEIRIWKSDLNLFVTGLIRILDDIGLKIIDRERNLGIITDLYGYFD